MSGVSDRLKNITDSINSNSKNLRDTKISKRMTDYKFFGWVGKDKEKEGRNLFSFEMSGKL